MSKMITETSDEGEDTSQKEIKTLKRKLKQKSRSAAKSTSVKSRWSPSTDTSSEEKEQTSHKTKIIRGWQQWGTGKRGSFAAYKQARKVTFS
ncbi:hypothetical protein FQR65_LT12745 [Abscondita terminalis]|nr:hypothetical protein FQR65_LT12745 [Abscondita terminalis]